MKLYISVILMCTAAFTVAEVNPVVSFLLSAYLGHLGMTSWLDRPRGNDPDLCHACGGDDVAWYVVDRIDRRPCEIEVTCRSCGHRNYWAYGRYYE